MLLTAAVIAVSALEPAYARDATVGACTQKDSFAKQQTVLDVLVRRLSSAQSDEQKASITASIASKYGAMSIENLIRYREPAMKHVFLRLLKHDKWPVRARALYALKMNGDPGLAAAVGEALSDKDPRVREMAANALGHWGDEKAAALLSAKKAEEKDFYVLASIEAALSTISADPRPYSRYKGDAVWKEALVGPEGAKSVEWVWVRKGENLFNDYHAAWSDFPDADSFCYPVSEYKTDLFCPAYPRRSFGANGNHAGEDCAWFREGCSYYAIANGVVRMVQGAGGDWGFLIVIEHRLPSGDHLASVYGHAAWDLLVKPGDIVSKGQKIATQGLSCSIENGGYGSHLHFGIGDGPFRRSKKVEKGSKIAVEEGGKKITGQVVRIVYAKGTKNQYNWPLLAAVVLLPGGGTVEKVIDDEPVADQISWLQAYIAGCSGWLDPEKFLPSKVEGK